MQVSLPVVRRFVKSVGDKAIGMGVVRGVRPDQQLVKVCSLHTYFALADSNTCSLLPF